MKLYIKSTINGGMYFLEPWDEDEYEVHSYMFLSDAREMAELMYDGRCDIAYIKDEDLEDYPNDIDPHRITYIDI